MSTPTPPPKPPLTLSPRPTPVTPPATPAEEPPDLPTFGTTGIPLATALLRLVVPLLVVAAAVAFSLFSSTLGLILASAILLAAVAAVAWPALGGRGGGRRPGGSRLGSRLGGSRLGRALGGSRLGRALRSAGGRGRFGLARARNGRFATGMRRLTGGRFPSRSGGPGGRRTAGGGPGGSRPGGLLGRARGLLSSRSGRGTGGSRSGGRPKGGRLGRFLGRRGAGGPGGSRSSHGSTGRPGGRAPGKGGSKGAGSTPSRGQGLLGKLTGGRLGRPGPGGRGPSGGSGGKRPGGRGGPKSPGGSHGKGPGKGGGKGRGKGDPGNWGAPGVEAISFGFVRGWIGLGKFVGNRVREVDGGAVLDALNAPFKPGKPKPFTAGVDDDTESDPMPDWWPGQTADDYVWPGQTTVDDYAWPKDHDKGKGTPPPMAPPHPPHLTSPHPPEQREHHEAPVTTRRNTMAVDVTDYSTHFEGLTEESTAADRKTALNEAAKDASARYLKQKQEAEKLRADARAAVKFPDRMNELNTKAAAVEGDAEKNRLLSSHFIGRSAEQVD